MNNITTEEKLINGEVETPTDIRCYMVNLVPDEYYKNPKKICEPCCGKGGFIPEIVDKLYNLLDIEEQGEERMKYIFKNCLFMYDINERNIEIVKEKYKDYELNIYCKSFLEVYDKYDIIIMNPPYNLPKKDGKPHGSTLWNNFLKHTINHTLNENGFLVSINPNTYRGLKTKHSRTKEVFKLLTFKNYMRHLKICKSNLFKGVRCPVDILCIEKTDKNELTEVIDEDENKYELNLKEYDWLPNGKFEELFKYFNKKVDMSNYKYLPFRKNQDIIFTDEKTDESYNLVIRKVLKSGIVYQYTNFTNEDKLIENCIVHGRFFSCKDVFINTEQTYLYDALFFKTSSIEQSKFYKQLYDENIKPYFKYLLFGVQSSTTSFFNGLKPYEELINL